jgi:uracil-DNA glycosylase
VKDQFRLPYFRALASFVAQQRRTRIVYPDVRQTFEAFRRTPRSTVRVVLVGQDPYHEPEQAHGLSFSVCNGTPIPPSLRNIRRELADDLRVTLPAHGDLTGWARQGVFLLNMVLTVRAGEPQSHRNRGWEHFTGAVIERLSVASPFLVFLLLGRAAASLTARIDSRHEVIAAPHPSPLSAHRGFFGSRIFSRCNLALRRRGDMPIRWEALD